MTSFALLIAAGLAQALVQAPAAMPADAAAVVPVAPAVAPAVVPAPAPATVAPVSQCELHVWPAVRFQAMTTGWLSGFGVAGAIADSAAHADGDKARRSHLASALDSEGQLTALQQLNLVQLLALRNARIVTHSEPLDRKTINKVQDAPGAIRVALLR